MARRLPESRLLSLPERRPTARLPGTSAGRVDDMRHTSSYTASDRQFQWSQAKNDLLRRERRISFDEVVLAIATGGLLDVRRHPNQARYPGQQVLIVAVKGYAYLVLFVEKPGAHFLKTIIPSRKATRDYLKGGNDNDTSEEIGG